MIKIEYPDEATPIDPDEAADLKLIHITNQSELNRWEQENISEALSWLQQTKPKDILNEDFVRKLHEKMLGNVWKWAGKYRKSDKNIGCSWQNIRIELKKLFDDTKFWIEANKESFDMIAVRFHHRLVSIHPFPNGNGRHARLITDLLLENVLGSLPFSWGDKNLTENTDMRREYIKALQKADDLDFNPLLKFVRS